MNLAYLIYQSRALIENDAALHNDILITSQIRNKSLGVSGFLHREDDTFVQYLEGTPHSLETLMQSIRRDPRHTNLVVLAESELKSRYFQGWKMGFANPDTLSLGDMFKRDNGGLIKIHEPMDLIMFLSANSDSLRSVDCAI